MEAATVFVRRVAREVGLMFTADGQTRLEARGHCRSRRDGATLGGAWRAPGVGALSRRSVTRAGRAPRGQSESSRSSRCCRAACLAPRHPAANTSRHRVTTGIERQEQPWVGQMLVGGHHLEHGGPFIHLVEHGCRVPGFRDMYYGHDSGQFIAWGRGGQASGSGSVHTRRWSSSSPGCPGFVARVSRSAVERYVVGL